MSTLMVMRKLNRSPKSQISVSSDRSIVDELRSATIDLAKEVRIVGEDVKIQDVVNAWVCGLMRLPVPERLAVTRFLVADLERWMLEQDQLTPDELLAGLREALALPQPGPQADDSGGVPRLRGKHTVGRPANIEDVFKPGKARPARRPDRKKMNAEAHR